VLEQDSSFPIEIIVHDDASTDNSVAHLKQHYPHVVLIESTKNVGFCIANNRMASAASGKYLLMLNNDAELFPDALRALYDAAKRIGRPAILGLPQYDAASGELIDCGSLFDPFLNPMPNLDLQRTDVGMIIGACLWIPRTLWQEIGGFPEWFHTLAEDMYVCCVARLWGYPVRVLAASGFRHWVGKSLGGGKVTAEKRLVTTRKRRSLSERNKTFVMILTYPAPLFRLLFPLHLMLLALEGILLALVKRDPGLWIEIYFSCLKSLLREQRNLSNHRRRIQEKRRCTVMEFFSIFDCWPHKLRMLWRHGMPEVR
jgi:GT2 family glycosyltransferase